MFAMSVTAFMAFRHPPSILPVTVSSAQIRQPAWPHFTHDKTGVRCPAWLDNSGNTVTIVRVLPPDW